MASAYYLCKGVHSCRVDGSVIILDLVRDRYWRLNEEQTGWYDEIENCHGTHSLAPSSSAFAAALCHAGILTRDAAAGRSISHCPDTPAQTSIIDYYTESCDVVDVSVFCRMALAVGACRAFRKPSGRNAARAARLVAAWKSRISLSEAEPPGIVEHRTNQFHRLAPYFMTTHNACFYSSMVLMKFLLGFGIRPDWVFGVRLSPFDAHCWLRHGDTLLNETSGRAAEYKMIMQL